MVSTSQSSQVCAASLQPNGCKLAFCKLIHGQQNPHYVPNGQANSPCWYDPLPSSVDCKYGTFCKYQGTSCLQNHSQPAQQQQCKYGAFCKFQGTTCKRKHPQPIAQMNSKICKYGDQCRFGPSCKFRHISASQASQDVDMNDYQTQVPIHKSICKFTASQCVKNQFGQCQRNHIEAPSEKLTSKEESKEQIPAPQHSYQHIVSQKQGYIPSTPQALKLFNLVKYTPVTALEIYQKMQAEIKLGNTKVSQELLCIICYCDLLPNDLLNQPAEEIQQFNQKQIEGLEIPDQVVLMQKCVDHCYHRECLELQLGDKDHLKCALQCSSYGVVTGDQPIGEISWRITPLQCAGFPGTQTWEIHYRFQAGTKNGNSYPGDYRIAFLPNVPEGREVLALLVKAFQRKLTFTVGRSVTTGQENRIVWNGIHHRTSISGGPTNYGYPDPTYFTRVKSELAVKGVLIDDPQEIILVTQKASNIFSNIN